MTVNRTTLLDLPLPVTGTESGTWGDTTNNGLTQYMDIAIAGMSNLTSANFTAGALTIETTEGDSSATNISATSAQYAGFRVSSLAVNSTITVGNTGTSPARSYRLINADATYSLTFKATGQTGVTLLPGQSAVVAFNGTDYVIVGVVGAGTATDNAVARFDGTTGEIIQNSGVTIDDSNNVSGVAQLNATTVDTTNVEVTNIKAKDGTAAATIADSTGVVSITANPVLSGGTANGVLYLNGSKAATSGSALTFDGTNLSVGGSNSQQRLNVVVPVFTTNASGGMRIGDSANNYYVDQLVTTDGSANPFWDVKFATHTLSRYAYGGGNNYWAWYANNSEQMRLTSTGLGIGTSSPATKLHVVAGGTGYVMKWSNAGTYSTGYLSGEANGVRIGDESNSESIYFNYFTNYIAFNTNNNVERMRLDSSGNLGLGVTPSGGTYPALEFGSPGIICGNGDMNIASNAYFNAGWKYKNNGTATLFLQTSGQNQWYTAPSGTAGNAVTWTQAMTLDASGRWMLGTTSPFNAIGASIQSQSGTWAAGIHLRGPSVSNGCYFAASTSSTTTDFEIWNEQNGYLRFATNNTERARITSGGYFKASDSGAYIGSTGAYHELVSSTGSATAAVYIRNTNATSPAGIDLSYSAASPNGTGNIFLYCQDSTALRMSVRSNGGIANYQSNNVDLSDARTKKDINPAASMWNKIGALEIVTYKYNDQTHDDVNVGVIAQQVERVEPVWVDADGFGDTPEDGVPLKTVYTKDITFAAIKALQEAMARIETLEAKVSALEGTQP